MTLFLRYSYICIIPVIRPSSHKLFEVDIFDSIASKRLIVYRSFHPFKNTKYCSNSLASLSNAQSRYLNVCNKNVYNNNKNHWKTKTTRGIRSDRAYVYINFILLILIRWIRLWSYARMFWNTLYTLLHRRTKRVDVRWSNLFFLCNYEQIPFVPIFVV